MFALLVFLKSARFSTAWASITSLKLVWLHLDKNFIPDLLKNTFLPWSLQWSTFRAWFETSITKVFFRYFLPFLLRHSKEKLIFAQERKNWMRFTLKYGSEIPQRMTRIKVSKLYVDVVCGFILCLHKLFSIVCPPPLFGRAERCLPRYGGKFVKI